MQAKVGLVTIFKNYKVSLNHKTITPIKFDKKSLGILAVDGNVWVNIEKCN